MNLCSLPRVNFPVVAGSHMEAAGAEGFAFRRCRGRRWYYRSCGARSCRGGCGGQNRHPGAAATLAGRHDGAAVHGRGRARSPPCGECAPSTPDQIWKQNETVPGRARHASAVARLDAIRGRPCTHLCRHVISSPMRLRLYSSSPSFSALRAGPWRTKIGSQQC